MKKILNFSYVLIIVTFFSSCLKDDLVEDQKYGLINLNANKIVGFNTATKTNALNFEDKAVVLELPVHLSSEDPATEDVKVSLSLANSTTLINEYNTKNHTSYVEFPSSLYTLEGNSLDVVIPKGQKDAILKFKTNAINFDPSLTYALGITIKSIDKNGYTVSGNYKNIIVTFGAKNKYDGVYTLTGFHNRTPYDYPYETEVELRTVNANTVVCYWPDASSNGHPIGIGPGNSMSWYGAAIAPAFTFDSSTNKIANAYNTGGATVISLYTSAQGSGALSNNYDPATKTIKVSWMYNNNALRAFFDTFTYVKARE